MGKWVTFFKKKLKRFDRKKFQPLWLIFDNAKKDGIQSTFVICTMSDTRHVTETEVVATDLTKKF